MLANQVPDMPPRPAGGGWRRVVYPFADVAERWVSRSQATTRNPPLIVLGPPRSGTSLLYQILTGALRLSYVCNYTASHPHWPALTTLLLRRKIRRHAGSYRSEYGATHGAAGPAEARKLWSLWYGYGLADEALGQQHHDRCRKTIADIEHVFGAPFVTKNPDHCNRVRALNVTFPSAVYVRVERNPLDTGRSVLNARKSFLGSYNRWFGVRPPEVGEEQQLDCCEEVAQQVYYLETRIDSDFADVVAPQQVITVRYSDLCNDPGTQIDRIVALMQQNGIDVSQVADAPPSFEHSRGKPLPDAMEEELAAAVERLYG